MSSNLDEIRQKVEAERKQLVAAQRVADGLPPEENVDAGWPPEWYADRDKTVAAVQRITGMTLIGGEVSDQDGSISSLEFEGKDGKKIQFNISPTPDGRSTASIFDPTEEAKLTPALEARKRELEKGQPGSPPPTV